MTMENNEEENTNQAAEPAAAEETVPAEDAPDTADATDTAEAASSGEAAATDGSAAESAAAEPADAESTAEESAAKEPADDNPADGEPVDAKPADETPAEAPKEPDWKEMYARTMADFDNFRKRTARDREELFKSAATDILKDLLPTVDNLALALDKATDKEDPFVKGVQLVYDGLVKMLADHGAVPVDSLGEPLDTNFHEAIATLPSPEVPEGHVMTEVKRGWLLNGKVLRAAQVVVSAGKGE